MQVGMNGLDLDWPRVHLLWVQTRRHKWPLMSECSLPDGVTGEWHRHLEDNLYFDALAKIIKIILPSRAV